MDRAPNRRGRHGSNAESVSVADLLARTTPAELASVSAIQERAAAEARAAEQTTTSRLPAVVNPAVPAELPRLSNRLAKTIVVSSAAMLICGVFTAASVLTTERPPTSTPTTPTMGPALISGPIVVRPDLLNQQLATGLLAVSRRDAGSTAGTQASGSAASLLPEERARADRLSEGGRQAAGTIDGGTRGQQAIEAVREFYRLAEDDPVRAFGMLGPQMQGDGQGSFVGGWHNLRVTVPDISGGEGGVVRAVVVIAWLDATIVRSEQLLVVSDGPAPMLLRAELLSAYRG